MNEMERMRHRLLGLHVRTRDRRCLKAAEILAGPPITTGRDKCHDEPHLLRMAWLIAEGHASSRWGAAGIVAGEIKGHSYEAVQKRLSKKFKKRKAFYSFIGPSLLRHIEIFADGVTNAVPA